MITNRKILAEKKKLLKQKKSTRTQEVYVVTDSNGAYLYIGSGAIGRHKHCLSGVSHVYELNALHFSGAGGIECKVVKYFDAVDKAREYELDLIKKYSPLYNKVHNNKDNRIEKCSKAIEIKNYLFSSISSEGCFKNASKTTLDHIRTELEKLLSEFSVQSFVTGVSMSRDDAWSITKQRYKSAGLQKTLILGELFEFKNRVLRFTDFVVDMNLPKYEIVKSEGKYVLVESKSIL